MSKTQRLTKEFRQELVEYVMELQQGRKAPHVVLGILRGEPHNLSESQASSIWKSACEAWQPLPFTPGKERHIASLAALAERAERDGKHSTAAKLLIEIGLIEGHRAPVAVSVTPTNSDVDRKRFEELLAKYKAAKTPEVQAVPDSVEPDKPEGE